MLGVSEQKSPSLQKNDNIILILVYSAILLLQYIFKYVG